MNIFECFSSCENWIYVSEYIFSFFSLRKNIFFSFFCFKVEFLACKDDNPMFSRIFSLQKKYYERNRYIFWLCAWKIKFISLKFLSCKRLNLFLRWKINKVIQSRALCKNKKNEKLKNVCRSISNIHLISEIWAF